MSERRCQVSYPGLYEGSEKKFAQLYPLPGVKGSPRLMVGRREWLSLPDIGVLSVHAKVDTGARSSSLHAEEIEVIEREGAEWVRFVTHERHGKKIEVSCPVSGRKTVKSSNGVSQKRVFIETVARTAGGLEWPLSLSLASRGEMKCPLLLGRQALTGRFVVDVQRTNLLGSVHQLEHPH
ncbi:MAG: ATP-dependent zinc protease [Verrucomicrobiales bacterium]